MSKKIAPHKIKSILLSSLALWVVLILLILLTLPEAAFS